MLHERICKPQQISESDNLEGCGKYSLTLVKAWQIQYGAQFPNTFVCNHPIYSLAIGKFLRFLSVIEHLLYYNMIGRLNEVSFKLCLFPQTWCPVSEHGAQFPNIDKRAFFHENARSKLMCQILCWMFIPFSLRFAKKKSA